MTTALQLTLADISRLTGVQRPVVSTWRRRSAGTDLPFPAPVARVGGQERFDGDAVLGWLQLTGRGTTDLAADAPAFALPAELDLRDTPALGDGLTALLCLTAISGESLDGLGEAALLALATAHDPADELMVRELQTLGPHLPGLAAYADQLVEAAYGPAEAFERLLTDRHRHALTDSVVAALARPVHELVVALAISLARACGSEPPVYVDITGGGDVFVSVLRAESEQSPTAVVAPSEDAVSRRGRRRLRVHDVPVQPSPAALDELGPVVAIASYPPAGQPDMPAAAILDAVDELALGLDQAQRAVVVAPASVLVDPVRDAALEQARSGVLRTGRVRVVLRLPAGLATHRSRQALAVWVLGPSLNRLPVADRWIALTDISELPLTTALVQQLREDAVAATAEPRVARAHSYTRARLVPLSAMLAQRGSLAPPRVAPRQPVDPAAAAVKVQQLREDVRVPVDPLGGVEVTLGASTGLPSLTVSDALRQRQLRMVQGNRSGFDLVEGGTVPVLGVTELTGTPAPRRVDRLAFLGGTTAARLTEPGDVVFCTSPRPRAVVDAAGGSAVQYPARVLRIHPVDGEGMSPHVLAHTINAQPEHSRAWRTWPVHRLVPEQVQAVDAALTALQQETVGVRHRLAELDSLRDALLTALKQESVAVRHRLAELDSLRDALLTAATAGALTLTPAPTPERNHP